MSQSALALAPAVIITAVDGIPTTLSTDVARHFGKKHDDVLRAIRNLLPALDSGWVRNFAEASVEVDQPNGGKATYPAYRLTRDGFTLLAMGFTGKKALQFKLAYINAFNRMEAELSNQAHNPSRSIQAQSLASEVAAATSRTVYETVVSGGDLECTRWVFCLGPKGEDGKLVPWCRVIDRGAHIASMAQLAEIIQAPNGICPTDVELIELASACVQRLSQRIAHRAAR